MEMVTPLIKRGRACKQGKEIGLRVLKIQVRVEALQGMTILLEAEKQFQVNHHLI